LVVKNNCQQVFEVFIRFVRTNKKKCS